jgi:hypothetical protein
MHCILLQGYLLTLLNTVWPLHCMPKHIPNRTPLLLIAAAIFLLLLLLLLLLQCLPRSRSMLPLWSACVSLSA